MPSSWASSVSSSRPPPATSASAPAGRPAPSAASRGDPGQHGVGVRRARRAPQQHRVAGLQAQSGGVDRDVRPRLVDDGDHAERDSNLAEVEPVGQAAAVDDLADRVRQRRDRARAVGDPAHARLVQAPGDPSARPTDPTRGRLRDRARWPRGSPGSAPPARRRSRAAPRPSSRTATAASRRAAALAAQREIGHGRGRRGDGCGHRGSLGSRASMTTILRARVAHTPRDPFNEAGALETFDDGAVAFDADGTILATGPFDAVQRRTTRKPRSSTAATACCCPGSSTPTSTSRRSP